MVKETLLHGDCLSELKRLENNSVDSVVTDPPYGLSKEPDIVEVLTKWLAGEEYDHGHNGFMGKSWDSFVPHPDIWAEVFRVLKPGGHALVFAGTRTQDLITISLRLAGFEVRDVIEWLYFSGFPKSHDVSKAFDRRAGAERKVVGEYIHPRDKVPGSNGRNFGVADQGDDGRRKTDLITAPATELARKWDGWGTALKPAHEPIIVVRKPLIDADTGRKLTVTGCVEKYGTGAINIGASRIGDEEVRSSGEVSSAWRESEGRTDRQSPNPSVNKGRFPANIATTEPDAFWSKYCNVTPQELSKKASKKDRNSDWKGEEIELGEKVTTDGRQKPIDNAFNRGMRLHKNSHPTVKPTDLRAWLVRLVTPEGGTVLDPFAGSGSTLVAAKREGFGFIGIELMEEYIPIIEARTGVKADKQNQK